MRLKNFNRSLHPVNSGSDVPSPFVFSATSASVANASVDLRIRTALLLLLLAIEKPTCVYNMAGGQDLQTINCADAATKNRFDFFGLPRELRNEVYSLLAQDLCLCSDVDDNEDYPTAIEIRVVAAPLPKLFTLCRRFKTENEERFKCGLTAIFKDLGREI